jgi:hypothetical protein
VTGAVLDFITVAAHVRQGVWPRGIRRLVHDPWAAALVAQHALTIYERFRDDPEWRDFFTHVETMRDRLVAQSRLTAAELARDYAFVRTGDLISLVFCNEWNEPQAFGDAVVRRDSDRVLIAPDSFAGREIPIAVNAREIPNRRYASDAELHDALRRAPAVTLRGLVRGE